MSRGDGRDIRGARLGAARNQAPISVGGILLVAIGALLVLGLIPAGRLMNHDPVAYGTASYKTLGLLQSVDFSNVVLKDPQSEMDVGVGMYLRLLKLTALQQSWLLLVPLCLGIFSAVLFYVILHRLVSAWVALISAALFVSSPLYISIFAELSMWSLLVVLMLLSVLCAQSMKRGWLLFFIAVCVLENFLAGIACALLALPILLRASGEGNRKVGKGNAGAAWVDIGVVGAFAVGSLLLHPSIRFILSVSPSEIISDLGGAYALSVPFLFLLLIGAVVLWNRASDSGVIVLWYILSLAGLLLELRVVLLAFYALLAGMGLDALVRRKWSYALMKQMTLVLIACTIFFSMSTAISLGVHAPPAKELVDDLKQSVGVLPEGTPIIARPAMGEFISYFTKYHPLFEQTQWDYGDRSWLGVQGRLSSRDLSVTSDLFQSAKTPYLLIDDQLRADLSERGQGVLFLISAAAEFKTVYSSHSLGIYAFNVSR